MADKFDQEDPFKKYGGNQIDQEDPFKKYGGVSIEEPSKKKIGLGIGGKVGSSVGRLDVGAGITEIDDKGKPVGGALSRVSGITTPEQAKISRVNKAVGKIESFAGSREDFEEIYKQSPQEFDNLAKQVAPNVNKGEIDKFYTTEAAQKDAYVDRVFQSYNQQKTKAILEWARKERPVKDFLLEGTLNNNLSSFTGKQYQLPQSEAQVSEILSDLNNEKEKLKTELTTNWNLSEVQTKAKELSEIEAAIRQNLTYQVGRMALERLSQNNPNVTSKDIGKEIFRVLHPDEYDLYEKVGGDKPVSFTVGTQRDTPVEADALNEQMVKLGNEIKRMYGNETAIQDADIEEQTAKRKYTFHRQAQVKQKIAAILHERGLSPDKATEELKDRVVNKYLPDEDKEIWYNNNKIYNDVDLPSTGFAYSLKNAYYDTVKDAVGTVFGGLMPNRKKMRAAELLEGMSTSDVLGEDPQFKARLSQLKEKEKTQQLNDQEKQEKEQLEQFTDLRSKKQKIFDMAGSGVGQILGLGSISAFTGGLSSARTGLGALKSLVAPSGGRGGIMAASYLMSHENNAKEALRMFPNEKDALKRFFSTEFNTAIDMAVEQIFPEEQFLSGIAKKEVSKLITNLTAKNIASTLNDNAFKQLAKNIVGRSKKLLATPLQETAEEEIALSLKKTFEGIIAPDKSDGLALKDVVETGEQAFWGSVLLGAPKGVLGYTNNKVPLTALWDAASSQDGYTKTKMTIERLKRDGELTEAEAKDRLDNLELGRNEYLNNPILSGDMGGLDAGQKQNYFARILNEAILKKQADAVTDPNLKKQYEQQIKESEAIREKIYKGEIKVTPENEELTKQEFEKKQKEQPTIDQDRVLGDEEAVVSQSDEELLTTLQELAQEGVKNQDLQFFVDQAANAPNQFIETYGEQVTQELLDKATTEQIQKGLEDARKFENNPNVSLLEKELERRGKTIADFVAPQEVSTGLSRGDEISVGEMVDKTGTYKGEKGSFYQDGQTVVFKVEGKNKEYELGNINEIKDSHISDFDISHEESVVSISDNGDIKVREQDYKNNYSNPLAAINKDADGNVVSVNLETADGKKRTFRGNIAEDIAYQIHLKEINKNNETRNEFEQHLNEDATASKEMDNGAVLKTTKKEPVKNNGPVSREKVKPKQKPVAKDPSLSSNTPSKPVASEIAKRIRDNIKDLPEKDLGDAEANKNWNDIRESRKRIKSMSDEELLKEVQKGMGGKLINQAIYESYFGMDITAKDIETELQFLKEQPKAETPTQESSTGLSRGDVGAVKGNGKKIISKALGEKDTNGDDFKQTKVVDENGKPKQVFHGTWADAPFEDFKEGDTYFTDNYDTAKMFGINREGGVDTENMDMQGKPFVMEVTDTKGNKHKKVIANTDMASIFSDLQYDVSPVGEWDGKDLEYFDSDSIEHHFGVSKNKVKSLKIEERKVGKNVDDFGVSKHYINIENPLIIDAKGDIWNGSKGGDIQGKINEARESGKYDGVIVKNIVEGGLGNPDTKPTTTYVVFNKKSTPKDPSLSSNTPSKEQPKAETPTQESSTGLGRGDVEHEKALAEYEAKKKEVENHNADIEKQKQKVVEEHDNEVKNRSKQTINDEYRLPKDKEIELLRDIFTPFNKTIIDGIEYTAVPIHPTHPEAGVLLEDKNGHLAETIVITKAIRNDPERLRGVTYLLYKWGIADKYLSKKTNKIGIEELEKQRDDKLAELESQKLQIPEKPIKSLSPTKEPKTKAETPTQETTPVSEPTTPPTTQAKELADKVRKLKIDLGKLSGGGLQSNPLGLPVAVWNGAMDIIAKTIETGGNIADAIKRGLNYIQKNHRGQWNKKQFNDEVMKELGVRGITVNGEDLVVKDVDKEFAETINGFYSDLEQTILDVSPTDKGTSQAWLKKIGTGDEAKWTGVTDWLNSLPKDQKVTRKEILDWLKDNRIQVVEVVKGGERYVQEDKISKYDRNKIQEHNDTIERLEYLIEVADENATESDFEYVREKIEKEKEKINEIRENYLSGEAKWAEKQVEGEKNNYKEILVTFPVKDGNYSNAFYEKRHFDEPNILVHLRMNTRTDAEGKKVLFLEEVQSDWGQKGKKEGFEQKNNYEIKESELYDGNYSVYKNGVKVQDGFTKEGARNYVTQKASNESGIASAPFVTDTNAWVKLGLKVALKEAVKQGADKIAWTTGKQQVGRYENDLRKQVDKIETYKRISADVPSVHVVASKGNNQVFDHIIPINGKTIVSGKEVDLEDVVGKEIANKIRNSEEKQQSFEGDALTIGGKGMKGFYGSPEEGKLGIVGGVAKSLFKQEPKIIKVGNLKYGKNPNSETYSVYFSDKDGYATDYIGTNFTKEEAIIKSVDAGQHSIDITPELKQEAETGLPLFKDIKGRGKEIADLLRKGKIKMGGLQSNIAGIPIAIYNAAIETIALALEGGATLTQAIQKAINKHKLNQQKGFNQKEFISKLEDATGEKFTDDQQQPPPPQTPKQEPKEVGGDMGGKKKAVLNRLYNAKNVPQSAKEGFEREGLTYKPKSQKEAAEIAKSILDEFGVDEAVELADSSSMFEGDVRTLIFAEALDRLQGEENAARWEEVAIAMDKFERSSGRAASAVNYFYKNNPYGVQLKEEADRKEAFDKWATSKKEKSWKEFFEEFKKDPEFNQYFKEQVYEELKKERAKSRQGRIKKVRDVFAKAKASVGGKGAVYSAIIPPKIITGALDVMEKLYEAGEAVAEVIQRGIDYINKEYGTSWDSEKFREEWEEKLKEPSKAPLTEEEFKKKVLDRFRNRLKGLSDKQRDEVVRRMFDKVVNAGALEYDDLRDIIADVLGYGKLTAEEGKRLQELVKKRNAVGEAAKKAQEERTDKALEEYRLSEIEAGKAARELQELLWNKPDIIKRLTSIMQLSTLGIPSLINNPVYNFFNQLGVRFPVGLINSTIDKVGQFVANKMGKNYVREYNIFDGQAEFWAKLGVGSKEAVQQLFTGLNRQDYIQKEYYGQQIRPMRAIRDLIRWKAGEKKLTKAQVIDKALQASVGIPAEVVARFLNIGDKPQRFAAEGSQAAAFAKALGLKDIDRKLFIEFPKEEAYRAYKAQGLSDEAAATKSEYIKEAIIKEGQRSTFQQDNMLNDMITGAFGRLGGKDSGLANLTKSLVVSPYIKIPTNAFWSYYNLVNPEVAILQSFYHAGRAKMLSNKGDEVAAKLQSREARYWLAHALTGMAMRGLVVFLVQAGIFVAGNTGDESKKEREAESFFEQPGTLNISKLWALMRGEDPKKVKNGVLVSNRWFGQFGTLGNSIMRKWEDMTPEQRENQQKFWNIAFGGMELEALKEMENGIFANTSSLLDVVNTGDFSRYGLNTINMFTNILQPASIAQINRASLNEVPQAKGDTFLEKLNQNFAQRSSLYRKAFDVQLQKKRSIWGEPMPKGGNILSRMFGITKIDEKKEGRPMYEDYMRTNDIGFLPPAVLQTMGKQKLNQEQYNKLQDYIGQSRKAIALPYIDDKAVIPVIGKKYSELNDKDGKPNDELRKAVLQYLYELGRDNGVAKFYQDYPEFKKPEKSVEEQVQESLLQSALELIKLQNKQ